MKTLSRMNTFIATSSSAVVAFATLAALPHEARACYQAELPKKSSLFVQEPKVEPSPPPLRIELPKTPTPKQKFSHLDVWDDFNTEVTKLNTEITNDKLNKCLAKKYNLIGNNSKHGYSHDTKSWTKSWTDFDDDDETDTSNNKFRFGHHLHEKDSDREHGMNWHHPYHKDHRHSNRYCGSSNEILPSLPSDPDPIDVIPGPGDSKTCTWTKDKSKSCPLQPSVPPPSVPEPVSSVGFLAIMGIILGRRSNRSRRSR